MPPLLEHLESLLTGTGEALDLQTFKLVDQLSGRMMGLRADTTPQVARIDAHLLNRQGWRACATAARCCTPARPAARHARAAAVWRRNLRPCRAGGRPGSPVAGAGLPARRPVWRCHRRSGRRRIVEFLAGRRAAGRQRWAVARWRWPPRTPVSWPADRSFPAAVREGLLALVSCMAMPACWMRLKKPCLPPSGLREALASLKLAGQPTGECASQLRPGRPAWLCLLQRGSLCHLCRRRQRRAGAWRPL
jgi:ATP phosphoribosyltransferase regulatory subunit